MTTAADTVVAILDSFQKNYGLDFSQLIADQTLSTADKRAKAISQLRPAIARKLNVPETDIPLGSELQADAEPNIVLDQSTLIKLHEATGDKIYEWITYYANKLALMQGETDPTMMAISMTASGLISIGAPMAIKVIAELRKAGKLTKAVVQSAITTTLKSTTVMLSVFAAIALLLIELLIFLANETREVCGLVVNELLNTNLIVSGWKEGLDGAKGKGIYMSHGEMKAFMDEPLYEVNLLGATIVTDDEGNQVASYPAGLYYGEKSFGFYGVAGMMLFQSADIAECFAISFASPYSGKNGTNASVRPGPFGSTDEQMACYDELNDGRRVEIDTSSERYRIKTAINSESVDSVACLSFITPK